MKNKIIFIGIIILLFVVGYNVAYFSSVNEVYITITDKERIVESNDNNVSSKYLIFTENEVYENTDAILFGKFKSSNLQGNLKVGETYKVKIVGWRIGIFSMYPNIIKIIDEKSNN